MTHYGLSNEEAQARLRQYGPNALSIFLHATIGQLFYAYPARRINAPPQFNGALHLAVILGIGLQMLTVLLPGLRTLLGLKPLTLEMLTLVSAAVLLTWGAAEAYSRIALSAHQCAGESSLMVWVQSL